MNIMDWLFWIPGSQQQGWLVYSAGILLFWWLIRSLIRQFLSWKLPLWIPLLLFLFPCRIPLETAAAEPLARVMPALPILLLSFFSGQREDFLIAAEASAFAFALLLPVWGAYRFYLRITAKAYSTVIPKDAGNSILRRYFR